MCVATGVQCSILAWGHPATRRLQQAQSGAECGEKLWHLHIQGPQCHKHHSKQQLGVNSVGDSNFSPLILLQDNCTRLVRHFQFHGWPEVGVPPSTTLIEFIREVQKLCRSLVTPHGPIVVHCRYVCGVGHLHPHGDAVCVCV